MIFFSPRVLVLMAGIGLLSLPVTAQFILYPVQPPNPGMLKGHDNPRDRNQSAALNLPFWDDFSTYTGSPDTSLWMAGSGVYVNRTHGINPPTLGVATFDGATANGGLYSTDPNAIGLADTLVSKPILLGNILPAEANSVYLSFFWEYEGAQELPDAEDSLRLQFLDQNNQWETIDVFTSADFISPDTFQQVIYQVKPQFLHNNFQFKFEEFGRLSGPYDAWHIDYVYLNKNRQVDDKYYYDRAVSTLPTSIFKGYTAIPARLFFADPASYIGQSTISIFNLDKIFQPIDYTAILSNEFDPSRVYDTLNFNTPLNPILQGQQRRTLTANPLNIKTLDSSLDSIYMNLKFYISSGDSVLPNGINYRVNDTSSFNFVLHNYLAYDDGTAEFGVGLDQNSGKIAYRFVVNKPSILNRVDISFINISRDQANTPFNLYIWKNLSGKPEDLLYERENQTVDPIYGFDQFQTIKLQETTVTDTFYVGIEQLSSDYLVIGYDKSNNTGDRIFYNVSGGWQQNTDLNGSLMIRPYFTSSDVPVGLEKPVESLPVRFFPNPASDYLMIEGKADKLVIYTITGEEVGEWSSLTSGQAIDVSHYQSGFYILQFQSGKRIFSRKIIIRH